jgi:hypothetical protein
MTSDTADDRLDRSLRDLRAMAQDHARADRVRARCRMELARREERSRRAAEWWSAARRVLAPALVGGLCVIYLAAVVGNALRLGGAL